MSGWPPTPTRRIPAAGSTRPNPPPSGGPDYGRFVEAVRTLQDHARAADAPDDVITKAADLIEAVSALLAPFDADEWTIAVGPADGPAQPRQHPAGAVDLEGPPTDEVGGVARFRRFHLGRNGAVHGGAVAQLFDSVLGFAAFRLTRSLKQRTAFLHVDYRKIVPIEKELQVDAGSTASRAARSSSPGRLLDGDTCWPKPRRCS